jgi:transcription elongation GreA/GreB family factor
MAAIECDGASYHTGKSVRDRDRIRQEILESLGWKNRIYRIWSTDWFGSPEPQRQRLLSFLEATRRIPFSEDVTDVEYGPAEAQAAATDAVGLSSEVVDGVAGFVRDEGTDVADLVVEAGDTVTYATASQPDDSQTVQIREDQRDFGHGIIPVGVPLAQAILGSAVGDVVPLRVPGRPVQDLRILQIVKPDGRKVSLK